MIKRISIAILLLSYTSAMYAQPSAYVGLVSQKSIGLYWENGLGASYSIKAWKVGRLFVGGEYLSSRYGSAWSSKALKQDSYLLNTSFVFIDQIKVKPFLKLNLGGFRVLYANPLFYYTIPSTSMLLSAEAGIAYTPWRTVMLSAAIGNNFIYGKGTNNVPGTLYPIFLKFALSYNIIKN